MSKLDLSKMSIQSVSEKLDLPKSTLRYWEKELEGLLEPHRTEGGQRRYDDRHISLVKEIKHLKRKGLSLDEIKRKLENSSSSYENFLGSDGLENLANRIAEIVKSELYGFLNNNGFLKKGDT